MLLFAGELVLCPAVSYGGCYYVVICSDMTS